MYEKLRCPTCLRRRTSKEFHELSFCKHVVCKPCLLLDMRIRVWFRSRAFSCPVCAEPMHPNDVGTLLGRGEMLDKYEKYRLRQTLLRDPDTRWCPKCEYAVIAYDCSACPMLRCENPDCGTFFCYGCGAEWHENGPCTRKYLDGGERIIQDDEDEYLFDDELLSSVMNKFGTTGFLMRDVLLFLTAPLLVLAFILFVAVTMMYSAPTGFATALGKNCKRLRMNRCMRFFVVSSGVTLFVIVVDLYLIPLFALILYLPLLICVYIVVIASLFRAVNQISCHRKSNG